MHRDPVKLILAITFISVAVGAIAANAHGDSLMCSSIQNSDQRAYCRAITLHDPSYCSSIHNSDLRVQCRAFASMKHR